MLTELEDHPHAYGDKLYKSLHCPADTGSSPRVWGQVKYDRAQRQNNRIIPTRMGTSFGNFPHRSRGEDHPHAYGDKKPTD